MTLAQARPKYNGRTGHHYNPMGKQLAALRSEFFHQWGDGPMLDGPIGLGCSFYKAMPKSWSQKKRKEMHGVMITNKPDCDNQLKFVMDAMTGVVYPDDGQVFIDENGVKMFYSNDAFSFVYLSTAYEPPHELIEPRYPRPMSDAACAFLRSEGIACNRMPELEVPEPLKNAG